MSPRSPRLVAPGESMYDVLDDRDTRKVRAWYLDPRTNSESAVCVTTKEPVFHEKDFKGRIIHKICDFQSKKDTRITLNDFLTEIKYTRLASRLSIAPRFYHAHVTKNEEMGVINMELLDVDLKTILDKNIYRMRKHMKQRAWDNGEGTTLFFHVADLHRIHAMVYAMWKNGFMHMDMHSQNFMYRDNALERSDVNRNRTLYLIDFADISIVPDASLETITHAIVHSLSKDVIYDFDHFREVLEQYVEWLRVHTIDEEERMRLEPLLVELEAFVAGVMMMNDEDEDDAFERQLAYWTDVLSRDYFPTV